MESNTNAAQKLLEENKKWAESIIKNPKYTNFFKDSANESQKPKVLWIGCSDSRVPASVITASMPGTIFVHTNIANQFHIDDDNAGSVLAYAVQVVGVEHVVVVGHSGCGGARTAIAVAAAEGKFPTGSDLKLQKWLTPLVGLVGTLKNKSSEYSKSEFEDKVIEINIGKQFANVCQTIDGWKNPAFAKKVAVHGWVYNLADGKIKELFCRHTGGAPVPAL